MKGKENSFELPPFSGEIVAATLLDGGRVEVKNTPQALIVSIPKAALQPIDNIVKLEVKGEAMALSAIPAPIQVQASASNVFQNNKSFAASSAVDENTDTRWATDPGTRQAWLMLDFGATKTFTGITVEEGTPSRVKKFVLEYQTPQGWAPIIEGESFGGRFHPFQHSFSPVNARVLRLNILDASDGPSLAEVTLEAR
jgi:alpha-L-fucosidase